MNPNVGRLDILMWGGDSNYDALQLQLKGRAAHGVQFQASYTWAKSIDTGSATIAGDQFANSIASLPWFDLRLNRGLSDFNIAHNLSARFTLEIPSPASLRGIVQSIASGWQFGGTYQASTGSPFTVTIGGDPLGLNSTDPYDVPIRLTGGTCNNPTNAGNPADYVKLECFTLPTLRGNTGRNSIIGPGLSNFDLSVLKNTYINKIADRFNAQLRIEVFNVFNHANFAAPLDHHTAFDQLGNPVSGFGLIDSTQTPSRQVQLGLKLIW
jgi:hypothetical protein